MLVLAGTSWEQPAARSLPLLTHADQVRRLSPEQAALGYPVRIRGVVTDDVPAPDFFVQDATAGIYVEGSTEPRFIHHWGEIVEIQGITGPGKFAPVILERQTRVVGKGTLPSTRTFRFSELSGGQQDSQWIQVRGIVRSVSIDRTSWPEPVLAMSVASGGGSFNVRAHITQEQDFSSWVDSEVLIEGVCGSLFNNQRQLIRVLFYVPDIQFIKVELQAKRVPFSTLMRFSPGEGSQHRVWVQGVVTYQQPGQALFLQNGGEGLRVLSQQGGGLAVGDVVDVLGFPAVEESAPLLEDAVFHRVSHEAPPQAIKLDLDVPWEQYDGALVTTEATLLHLEQQPNGVRLLLQQSQGVFEAVLEPRELGAARDGKVPTVYSFSFGIQHEIARGTTLDIAYVGTLGRHLVTSRDINAVPFGYAFTRAAQDPANYVGGVVPAVEPNLPAIYSDAGLSFSGAYAYGHPNYTNAALVPYKGYGQISYLDWGGTSNYNSLQASLQRRFSKGLTLGAVYTWSKALTTSTADQDYQNPVNALIDYRAADWDRTHVFAANYVYDLPKFSQHLGGAKWLSYLTDNFQLSGVTQAMTGAPNTGFNNGYAWNSGALDGSNMWGTYPYYFSIDKSGNLITPTVGSPTRATRDALRNGGMQNWDMSLFKNIPMGERYSVQLRLEAFNAFNHVNFQTRNYGASVNGPWQWTYGTPAGGGSGTPTISIAKNGNWGTYADTYNNTGGPAGFRVVQLGAKFYF